ncbi:MAG: threonine/serine dehydratase [Chloroflexota bacterium]
MIPLAEIEAARERLVGVAIRTPLIRLNVADAPADIYLKLENLQPIGSFKLRGAGNAMALADPEAVSKGVVTASAGNMAQGVAWCAQRLGVPCTVIVPDHAPQTKLDAIARLGGVVEKVTFDEWWQIIMTSEVNHLGLFIHPVSETAVMAGNGTIGLEILEDLPDVDAVITPYGGGGLTTGIASAIRQRKPDTKLYAGEVSTAAPLAASLAAGEPRTVDYQPTFIDGSGGKAILPVMWPHVHGLVDGSLVVSVEEVATAVRLLLERNRVLAEGAGAIPVAAALAGKAGHGKVVCVVSGGNLDASKLVKILAGEVP